MRRLKLKPVLTDKELKSLEGKKPSEEGYKIIDEDADVVCSETGAKLFAFRRGIIGEKLSASAYQCFRKAATVADNRGKAGGMLKDPDTGSVAETEAGNRGHRHGKESSLRYQVKKLDGTLSNYNRATLTRSGIIGYWAREPQRPYCRDCAWNKHNPSKWAKGQAFIRAVDEVFRKTAPDDHAAQADFISQVHPDFRIPETVFTTITVNSNWQTAIHTDRGNYIGKSFSGVMVGMGAGNYDGCFTVFPKYGVGIDLRAGDFVLFNNHLHHANTPLIPRGAFNRMTMVFYIRKGMEKCSCAAEELLLVQNRKAGKLYA